MTFTNAERVAQAHREGHLLGLSDVHRTCVAYATSEEWSAWLAGWRAGQAEFKAQLPAMFATPIIRKSIHHEVRRGLYVARKSA